MSNNSLYELLQKQEEENRSEMLSPSTTGSSAWDFIGQAKWGAAEQASFGLLGAKDAYLEGQYGDSIQTWEDTLAGDASGDWDELSNAGKAGYMVGSAIGMIPGFFTGGLATSLAVRTAGRVGGAGAKAVAKRSTQELMEAAAKIPAKQGQKEVSELLTQKTSKSIIDDAYEVASDASAFGKVEAAIGSELMEQTMFQQVRNNLSKTLNIADDQIVNTLSEETVKIVSRNNAANSERLFGIVAQNLGLSTGKGLIAGSMAYDAAIGVALATQKQAANAMWQKTFGVEKDDMDGYNYLLDRDMAYNLDYGKMGNTWLREALSEGMFMSILGPVKFWKGGTDGKNMTRLKRVFGQMAKSYYKPLNKYTNKELKAQLTAMDEISGGYLNASLNPKWSKMGDKWWRDLTDVEEKAAKGITSQYRKDGKLMQEYLGTIRRKFLTSAPYEWTKEFGRDIYQSLPRMGIGVVAMNMMPMMQSFYNNGLNMESLRYAFGESGEEIAANIMTAMYFTKKPHSFHTDSKFRFDEYFTTGEVPRWTSKVSGDINGKANKLRRIMGSLETFGVDKDRLKAISYLYGADKSKDDLNKSVANSIKKSMDSSREFSEIENVFKEYVGNENLNGVDLDTAFNKHIEDLINKGELTIDDSGIWNDKLFIARKLIDEYNANSTSDIDLEQFTPAQAFEIVRSISSIKFNSKELSVLNIDTELKDWTKKQIIKSIEQPQEIMKNYIIDTYNVLNSVIDKDNMIVPDIRQVIDFADWETQQTFSTVYDRGQRNNWITAEKAVRSEYTTPSAEQQKQLREVFEKYSSQLMAHTYGENWKDTRDMDERIMRNDAWHMTYDTALKMRQKEVAYQLLTGGKEHGVPSNEAQNILMSLNDLIKNKQKPKLEEFNEQPQNYGEVSKFIDDLHSIILDLNPTLVKNTQASIKFAEAEALKSKLENTIGDLFTQPETLREFKDELMDRALDKIGLNDANAGVDIKASFITMIKDSNMNYKTEGTKEILPSIDKISANLEMMLRSQQISRATFDSLKEHYIQVISSAEQAKFPMTIDDNVAQNNDGDWYRGLLKSKATGEAVLDNLAFDRAGQYVSFLSNEILKFNRKVELIGKGVNNLDATAKDNAAKEMQALADKRDATVNLVEIIKKARKSKDPYILRAVSRKDGDIKNVLNLLSNNPTNSTRVEYQTEMLRIAADIKNQASQVAINESHIADFIKNELKSKNIQDKDVQDVSLKITTPMFSNKYNVTSYEIDRLFEIDRSSVKSAKEIKSFAMNILGDIYQNQSSIKSPELQNNVKKIADTLNKLAGNIVLNPKNYNDFIVQPLKLQMQIASEQMQSGNKPSSAQMDSDLYGLTSNYFSKSVVKTVKIDMSGNKLIQGESVVGNTTNRGLTGILEALDPNQNNIYLVDRAGIDKDGVAIRDINTTGLRNINTALKSGNFSINHGKAESEFYKTGDIDKLRDTNQESTLGGEKYEIIQMNESVSLAVRIDGPSNAMYKELATQFSENGSLFKILEAVYDGDMSLQTPQHQAMRTLLASIRGGGKESSIVEGVKLTRMLLNMPSEIPFVLDNGVIDLEHSRLKKDFKYDKLNETKNGYVPTADNRAKTDMIYRNSESALFKQVHKVIEPWLQADKKIKAITLRDEKTNYDRSTDGANIFNSLDRATVRLKKKLKDGDFGPNKKLTNVDYQKNLKLIKEAQKSITDGETFVTKDFYLASMAMIGLHPDMVHTNYNNEVLGFKAGGIKPTVSYNNVDTKKFNPDGTTNASYGAIEQWFSKTAFKYNPVMVDLLNSLGVDMITFATANKKNAYKPGVGQATSDKIANVKPTKNDADLEMPWYEYVNDRNITQNLDDVRVEIPLEALSLRTISKEHDPSVGANTGIHMSDKNGIADWVEVDKKIDNYKSDLSRMYTDPYHRTALAQKVMGAMADSGDPSAINSAMNSILVRNGLIVEPWAQRKLEENLIGYYVNNGSIAGGVVPDGSLDVMTADYGTLDISTRSSISDRATVQYFGEFLPSYYAAQKKFKTADLEANRGIHNVLIQRIKYKADDNNMRDADAFLVNIQGEKFLQVEGRFIDKEGRLRDIDDPEIIYLDKKKSDPNNLRAYDEALRKETEAYKKQIGGKLIIDNNTTLAQVALDLEPLGLSIGMLNVRQPRNMMGDVVISKMAIVEQTINGQLTRQAHMDKNAGNVSMMNSIDAIKPQDADFDFDKSFNYVAAPGEFWRETNKVAGDIHGTEQGQQGVINTLFDKNIQTGFFSRHSPNLLGREGTDYDMIRTEIDMARGRFIKMHQTATYLSNMFKEKGSNYILNFEHKGLVDAPNARLQVRLADSGKMIQTVSNIGEMAKLYIDLYDKLPAVKGNREITELQNQILFGKNGIFDIGYMEKQKDGIGEFKKVDAYNLQQSQFEPERNAIRARYIDPLNKYLKYNQGIETDPAGVQTRATIEDYNRAYVNLIDKTLDISKSGSWGIDPRIDMSPGLNQAIRYFDRSQNPYDVAMRELHNTYMETSGMKQEGSIGQGYKTSHELVDYFENGFGEISSTEAMDNRIFNIALNEYIKDEGRIFGLIDLGKREKSLKIEIETQQRFQKNNDISTELSSLKQQLNRVQEVKAEMEGIISYMFTKDDAINPAAILPETVGHGDKPRGGFFNRYGVPLVVLSSKGDIKEVIRPNGSNKFFLSKKDNLIKNGKRYEVADGEQQQGLRILSEAFGGNPTIRDNTGRSKKFTTYELSNYLERDFREIRRQVRELGGELASKENKSRQDYADYSQRRKIALFDGVFKNMDDTFYTKALILRMLSPEVSDQIVSIRHISGEGGRKTQFDDMYLENKLSEPIMSLLSDLASGEYKPDYLLKDFANEILDDISIMKNTAYIASKNPGVDIELVTSRMYTEPASLAGYLTQEKMISQDVFSKLESQNANERDAARVMVDYATGKLVDPVILYKASKVMEEGNIPIDQQWGKIEYMSNPDGTIRKYGVKKIFISQKDALRRKDLGEKGGLKESTQNMMKNKWSCLKNK